MQEWYKSNIIYETRDADRQIKPVKEFYLHLGISYGDVEAQCMGPLFIKRIKTLTNEYINSIGKYKLTQLIFHPLQEEDSFWQVKVVVLDVKKYTWTFLVPAISDIEASTRVREEMKNMMVPWKVVDVRNSDVLAVWRPGDELWEGDWHNRMERLYDEGKFEVDHNQEPAEVVPKPKKNKKRDENQMGVPFEQDDDEEANDDEREIVKSVREIRNDWKKSMSNLKAEGVTVSVKGPGDTDYKPIN